MKITMKQGARCENRFRRQKRTQVACAEFVFNANIWLMECCDCKCCCDDEGKVKSVMCVHCKMPCRNDNHCTWAVGVEFSQNFDQYPRFTCGWKLSREHMGDARAEPKSSWNKLVWNSIANIVHSCFIVTAGLIKASIQDIAVCQNDHGYDKSGPSLKMHFRFFTQLAAVAVHETEIVSSNFRLKYVVFWMVRRFYRFERFEDSKVRRLVTG